MQHVDGEVMESPCGCMQLSMLPGSKIRCTSYYRLASCQGREGEGKKLDEVILSSIN